MEIPFCTDELPLTHSTYQSKLDDFTQRIFLEDSDHPHHRLHPVQDRSQLESSDHYHYYTMNPLRRALYIFKSLFNLPHDKEKLNRSHAAKTMDMDNSTDEISENPQ